MDEHSLLTNSTRSKLLIPPTRAVSSESLTHPLRRPATRTGTSSRVGPP
jgi:hypothetical protein